MRLAGFPPVIDAGCEMLILGSFPGVASLAAGHYYAHPRNQFWRIVGACLDASLDTLPFEERYRCLRSHRVGLWDVLASCQREGSLDAGIREADDNDLEGLLALAPGIVRVLFNGRTAGRHAGRFEAVGIQTSVLPSTSPAHAAMSLERKLHAWRAAFAAAVPRQAASPGALLPSLA